MNKWKIKFTSYFSTVQHMTDYPVFFKNVKTKHLLHQIADSYDFRILKITIHYLYKMISFSLFHISFIFFFTLISVWKFEISMKMSL
jgi:hypothetical protein